MSNFICLLHHEEFDEIPESSIIVVSNGGGPRPRLYRFPNGTQHLLKPKLTRQIGVDSKRAALLNHARWHKNKTKEGCKLCSEGNSNATTS